MRAGHQLPKHNVYDFVDFGSSIGGSYHKIRKRFKLPTGLCVERAAKKCEKLKASKLPYIQADATTINLPDNCASCVCMSHFLEHPPKPRIRIERKVFRSFILVGWLNPAAKAQHHLRVISTNGFTAVADS